MMLSIPSISIEALTFLVGLIPAVVGVVVLWFWWKQKKSPPTK
jgi:membrane protein DedA with SNARE-associated domain